MERLVLTSKEHFNKYNDYIKDVSEESLINITLSLYLDSSELLGKFLKDCHLNNLNMHNIDNKFYRIQQLVKKSMSLADSCCIIKHFLIYKVLMYKPIFEEDIINYDELRQEWLNNKKYYKQDYNVWFIKNKLRWVLKQDK